MISQSVPAPPADQPAAGLFMLAWGLFASGFGLATLTNFRGFADSLTRHAHAPTAGLRRLPPWSRQREPDDLSGRSKLLRVIAFPFAVLGPIMTVAGIVAIAHGHITIHHQPSISGPLQFVFVAAGLASVGQFWRPGGFYRIAAQRRGWRRTVAVLASLGGLAFGLGLAFGYLTISIAAWMVTGLLSLALLAARKTAT